MRMHLHEFRVIVDEDDRVFLQPAVPHESGLLLLVLLLTLVTNVPKTFTQFLNTSFIFSVLSRFYTIFMIKLRITVMY